VTTAVDELLAFLEACIADDEQEALKASARCGPEWRLNDCDPVDPYAEGIEGEHGTVISSGDSMVTESLHIARWDPKRVLDECAAKRKLIAGCVEILAEEDSHDYILHGGTGAEYDLSRLALSLMAKVYADRPGFKEEWKP
jgi:hypothetical protein